MRRIAGGNGTASGRGGAGGLVGRAFYLDWVRRVLERVVAAVIVFFIK